MISRRGFIAWGMRAALAAQLLGADLLDVQERAIQEVVGEVFDVRDFGATGDGVTDDLPAIQAAVDAAQRSMGTVYYPPGTYAISGSLADPGVGP